MYLSHSLIMNRNSSTNNMIEACLAREILARFEIELNEKGTIVDSLNKKICVFRSIWLQIKSCNYSWFCGRGRKLEATIWLFGKFIFWW
jgi:hypothetical protein